jgi:hypothetical protein
MDSTSKLYFVVGFAEALSASGVAEAVQAKYLSGATLGETVKGLDQFYEDPANAAIPVMMAFHVFALKVKGATPEDLAAEVAELRRIAARVRENEIKPSAGASSTHGTARLDDIDPDGTPAGAAPIDLSDLGAVPVPARKP